MRDFIKTYKLYAPSKLRDLHKTPIPGFLGVAFLPLLLIGTFFYSNLFQEIIDYPVFLLSLFVITVSGVRDDLKEIGSKEKLIYQLLAINLLLITNPDLLIDNCYGFLGIYTIAYPAAYMLNCFIGISIINAFNLIDGIDGNAGINALVSFIFFGVLFWITEVDSFFGLCILMCSVITSYLIFNFSKKEKGFMGDTGSLFIGFLIFTMTLVFMNQDSPFLANSLPSKSVLPLAPLCIFVLPIIDTLSAYSYRVKIGKSPFSPDNYHLHHLALRLISRNHFFSALIINSITVFFVFIFSLMAYNLPPTMSIVIFFAMIIFLVLLINSIRTKLRRRLGSKAKDVVVIN